MRLLLQLALLVPLLLAAAQRGAWSSPLAPPSRSCFDCPWLDLPLDDWSAERNETVREQLPWGQVVEWPPLDYRQLAEELCECVLDTLEGPEGTHSPPNHFVRANGTLLEVHGAPFRFAGFNAQQALSWAASGNPRLLGDLETLFSQAQKLGLKVGRVWASTMGPKVRPPFLDLFNGLVPDEMQEAPWAVTLDPTAGGFNETALQALDHVVDLGERYGIRLTLTLADYIGRFGPSPPGIEPYLQWVTGSLNLTGLTVLDFYQDERAKLLFKHQMCHMANRVSSISGVKYKDNPALFSWDLLNEPRCPACPGATRSSVLVDWADEMTSFTACVDPNHMVSVGTEGYFSESEPQFMAANPGSWAVCEGVGFTELASLPHLSYGVAHMYSSMRGDWDEATRSTCGWDCIQQWFRRWLAAHIAASSALDKPFILEEFSVPWAEAPRNDMFRLVEDTFTAEWRANASSPAAGAMFWGATAGDHIDWDGWQVRLDRGRSAPAPTEAAQRLREQMPAEQDQWLADVELMQKAFRRDDLAKACHEAVKEAFSYVFAGYSSNSTLAIVQALATAAGTPPALALPPATVADGSVGQDGFVSTDSVVPVPFLSPEG